MLTTWAVPSVLVAREKDDNRHLKAATVEQFHASALALLTERWTDEIYYWYDEASPVWKKRVETVIANADGYQAWLLLLSRRNCEYEGVCLEPLEA